MKGFSTKLFSVLMALAILGCASSSKAGMKPGTYQGTAFGFNGDVVMEVTVDAERIISVRNISHNDSPGISDPAYQRIPKAIVDGQTLAVDAVAGASFSSKGIIGAVTQALEKAGADIAALQSRKAASAAARTVEKQSADIVIIGAGGGGLAAAVSAAQNGAKVIVIEKMPRAGGNTIISGSAYNTSDAKRQAAVQMNDANRAAIGSLTTKAPHDNFEADLQKKVSKQYADFLAAKTPGMFDSPEWHALQTYNGGDYVADPEMVMTLTSNTLGTLDWLISNGMGFTDRIWTVLGALWPRTHTPALPLGTGFIKTGLDYIEKNKDKITLLVDTKATELIVSGGRVSGVKAAGLSADYEFTARKAVIIATGGFSANKELRQKYNTQWPNLDNAGTTNHPGATGDGLALAEKAGANFVGMDYVQLLPMGDPVTGSLSGNIEQGVEDRFFVNKKGDRFVDEGARRDVMTKELFAQPDAYMWVICDSQSYPTKQTKNNFNETIEELIQQGRAFEGNTWDELAAKIQVPAASLKASVAEFNKGVDDGKDKWGRTLWRIKIDKPPFYAGPRIPTVHHTMGGIQINPSAQVLDTSGRVIPGLYACGEVTGGIHGSNRLGGNALADIHTFGRIAGAAAAAEK